MDLNKTANPTIGVVPMLKHGNETRMHKEAKQNAGLRKSWVK
jgi:hypothetical protein